MLERLLDIIGKVLDKFFVPTIISLVVSIGIYSVTQDDFWLLIKLSKELYICLLTLVILLAILTAKTAGKMIMRFLNNLVEQQDNEDATFERLLGLMDALEPKDQTKIRYFVENNNKQLILLGTSAQYRYSNSFLLNYCDMQDFIANEETKGRPVNEYDLSPCKGDFSNGYAGVRVKLKDSYYNGFKRLKEKTGKISRFD